MGDLIPIVGILMVFGIPMLGIWTKHQQKMADKQCLPPQKTLPSVPPSTPAMSRQLEDRVRVLERIVTDKGYDVATQIEALRDARRTEALIDARDEELR